jgi:hypothetical protein
MTNTKPFVLAFTLGLVTAACGEVKPDDPDPDAPPPPATPRGVVVSGNFQPGSPGVMSALDIATMTVTERVAPTGAVLEDPMVRAFGDELFVVNRAGGNNVTILDAKTFGVVEQIGTGAGSNPQDVAVIGSKLYVPAFGTPGVVVLTRGSSAAPMLIDLSAVDPDGLPDCISAFAVGTDVYVACEILDETFTARGPGLIAVIDSTNNTLKSMTAMRSANPFGVFERMPDANGGALVIGTVPAFGDPSQGCVEKITPGPTPTADGCIVTNQQLGSNAGRIAFQEVGGMTLMWMVVSSFGPNGEEGKLRAYDLGTNMLWDGSITPPTQIAGDIAPCPDGKIVVADKTMAAPGLRVYEVTLEKTSAALPIGLAPASSHGLVCY